MFSYRHAHWYLLSFLLMTFMAFMPSYFLKLPTAPWVHHLHGITATMWVVLVAAQNWTAHRGNWKWHVRAGTASLALVPIFTVGGLLVTQHMLRTESLFNELFGRALGAADLLVSVAFVGLYTLALRHRRNHDSHARYMLATVILLIGPSLSRFIAGYVPGFLVRSLETLPNFGHALNAAFILTAAFCMVLMLRDQARSKPSTPFALALLTTIGMFISYHVIGYHPMYSLVADELAELSMLSVVSFGLLTSSAAIAWGWLNPLPGKPTGLPVDEGVTIDAM